MKNTIFILFFTLISCALTAQDFEIQHDYDFKLRNDYEKYDQTIIDISDWMMSTPITLKARERRRYQTFLMNWAAGHPKVKVILNEWTNVTEIGDKNPVLLIIFIAAWSRESIKSGDYDNLTKLHLASIRAVYQFYNENRVHLKKDRCVEKYVRLERKGKLEQWVRDRIE